MTRLGFYFEMAACIGCRTCQIACKDKNGLGVGLIFRRVRTFETGRYPKVMIYHYSGACNHCENPKCVTGCPTGAMHIAEDNTVQHDKARCIGCLYCTWNCPYGAPQFIDNIGKVSKCNMCKDLTDEGQNPVCVDACVMRCLKWGGLDELAATYGPDLINALPALPLSGTTKPSLLIKPKTAALDFDYSEKNI